MRKALIIIITVILLIGASGCVRAEYEVSPTPDAEVLPAPDVISEADMENADNIATAINAYNALHLNSMLPGGVTLEQAKETVGELLWPQKLTDEETEAAWKLIAYDNNIAQVSREAWETWGAMKDSEDEPEQIGGTDALRYAASSIATAVNAYNCLRPNNMIPDGVTIDGVKEALEGDGLWPRWVSDAEESEAWKLIDYRDGVAVLK